MPLLSFKPQIGMRKGSHFFHLTEICCVGLCSKFYICIYLSFSLSFLLIIYIYSQLSLPLPISYLIYVSYSLSQITVYLLSVMILFFPNLLFISFSHPSGDLPFVLCMYVCMILVTSWSRIIVCDFNFLL